jgi:hypothetical protein
MESSLDVKVVTTTFWPSSLVTAIVGVDALVCVRVDDFSVQLPPESDET